MSDLIGFQTYDFARHFLSACSRLLEVDASPAGVSCKGDHYCATGVYPIGVDAESIKLACQSDKVILRV